MVAATATDNAAMATALRLAPAPTPRTACRPAVPASQPAAGVSQRLPTRATSGACSAKPATRPNSATKPSASEPPGHTSNPSETSINARPASALPGTAARTRPSSTERRSATPAGTRVASSAGSRAAPRAAPTPSTVALRKVEASTARRVTSTWK